MHGIPNLKALLLSSLLLLVTVPGLHAEIIKRVNPDGSITYIVPSAMGPSAPSPIPPPVPSPGCTCRAGCTTCRVCTLGKPCGDTCIAVTDTCQVGSGCACQG